MESLSKQGTTHANCPALALYTTAESSCLEARAAVGCGQEDVQEEKGRIPWVSCLWQVCGSLVAIAALMAAVGLRGISKAHEVLSPCSRFFRMSQSALAISAYSGLCVCM